MEEIFIKKIHINQVRNIKDFEIPISETEKKHLIITGKNGSGKTSLLNELKFYLGNVISGTYDYYIKHLEYLKRPIFTLPNYKSQTDIFSSIILPSKPEEARDFFKEREEIEQTENWFEKFKSINIDISDYDSANEKFEKGNFTLAFFGAKRNIILKDPVGITKVELKPYYEIEENAGQDFIQYIVNLKADKSFARDDKDFDEANKIDDWFQQFEEKLFDLFEAKDAHLVFDRKSYNFNIFEPGKEPYNLNQLSDGYSAILNIVTELIMRMEEHKSKNYDVQGIVLIDEIETHLHIELQKKVLPFLISFFPKIQFIVTTHSPFVITSVNNAVVCDLEKREVISDDLSGYSYETIVESYFDSDKFSDVLKEKVAEYETLMSKSNLDDDEVEKLNELNIYFDGVPKIFADELVVKLQQIKLKNLKKKVQNDSSS